MGNLIVFNHNVKVSCSFSFVSKKGVYRESYVTLLIIVSLLIEGRNL